MFHLVKAFPTKGVILKIMIPTMIVKGKPDPDFNQERILFGSYALFYTGTTNNMNRIIIPYIALNKSNNHGGH